MVPRRDFEHGGMTIELLSRPTVYAGGTVPGKPIQPPTPGDAPQTDTPPPDEDGEQNPS